MIIDIKKIRRSKNQSEDFCFEYQPDGELIDVPNVNIAGSVKILGSAFLTGEHSVQIDGEVCFTIAGECTRCLKETSKQFVKEFSETADSQDEEGYPVKNDTVDLKRIVDDVILMNVPLNFLCSEDCKGICTGCGVNLNDENCKCKK